MVGRILSDIKEVVSAVRDNGSAQRDRDVALDIKLNDILRRQTTMGRRLEDLITEFNVSILFLCKSY